MRLLQMVFKIQPKGSKGLPDDKLKLTHGHKGKPVTFEAGKYLKKYNNDDMYFPT